MQRVVKHPDIEHIPLRGGSYRLGKYCHINGKIRIYTGKSLYDKNTVSTFPFQTVNQKFNFSKSLRVERANVIIGNDVWIGNNVTIMPGVSIGSGTIITPDSIVTESCGPYSIITGNPGVVVEKRFSEHQIKCLMIIKWWDWDNEKIKKNLNLICGDNIDKFINRHGINSNKFESNKSEPKL